MTELSFQAVSDRLAPQNTEAEEAVLGGILLDPQAIGRVIDILPPEAFSNWAHKTIYQAAVALYRSRRATDLMNVANYLYDRKQLEKVGGQSKLAQLVNRTVSAVNIDSLARLITDKYLRRCTIEAGVEIMRLAHEAVDNEVDLFSFVEERILSVTRSPYRRNNEEDYEDWLCSQIVEQYSKIELEVDNPATRYLKHLKLAERYRLKPKDLDNIYYKSLLKEENEPAMRFDEFCAKYGDSVNEWLMQGFLARGKVSLIYGKGGIGKTRTIYDWMYCVANGESWNGFPVTAKSRNVLLIQTDEAPADTIPVLNQRGFTGNMTVWYKSRWTIDNLPQLKKEVKENKIEWLIIDSLTSVNQNSVYSENDVEYARSVLKAKAFAQELNCHISFVHHANANGDARGTTAIVNAVSDVICIAPDPQDQRPDSLQRLLKIQKSRSRAPATYEIAYNPDDETWLCLGKQGEMEGSSQRGIKDDIVNFLHQNRNTIFEAVEIADGIGANLNSVRSCAAQLAKDGEISSKKLANRANGYWLACDTPYNPPTHISPDRKALTKVKQELRVPSDHSDQVDDQIADHIADHTSNPCDESVSESSDRVIAKNDHCDTHVPGSETDDHSITEPQNNYADSVSDVIDSFDQITITADQTQTSLTIPPALSAEEEALAECPFQVGDLVEEREGYWWGAIEEVKVCRKGSPKEPWYEPRCIVFTEEGERFECHPFFLQPRSELETIAEQALEEPTDLAPGAEDEVSAEPTDLVGRKLREMAAAHDARNAVEQTETDTGADLELFNRSLRSPLFKQALANASAEEIKRALRWSERESPPNQKRIEILKQRLDQLGGENAASTV